MLIDIVKQPNPKTTRCSNWREHHQIRRFIDSLDSLGYIDEEKQQAVLVVVDRQDPCKTRIITEDLLTPAERFQQSRKTLMDHAQYGYEVGMLQQRHANCRSVVTLCQL